MIKVIKGLEQKAQKQEFLLSIPNRVAEGIGYFDHGWFRRDWLSKIDLEMLNARGRFTSPLAYVYEGNVHFSLLSNETKVRLGFLLPEKFFEEQDLWQALTDEWKRQLVVLRQENLPED